MSHPPMVQSFHADRCFAAAFPGIRTPEPNKRHPQYVSNDLVKFTINGNDYSAMRAPAALYNPRAVKLVTTNHVCGHCHTNFTVGEHAIVVKWEIRPEQRPNITPRLVPKITFTRWDGTEYDPSREEPDQ